MKDTSMKSKVALVTGGGAGMGRAICLQFAREGSKVLVAERNAQAGEETAGMIRDAGGEALFVQSDISRAADVDKMMRTCLDTYGRLDYAVNNAGVEGTLMPLADCSEENWDTVVGINLKGTWMCLKAELQQMIKGGGGAIVNLSSVAGLGGFPGLAPYSAAKHGVLGLTKTAAMEYAVNNIRVNAICPGLIDTDMGNRFTGGPKSDLEQFIISLKPMKRRGSPAEVAEAAIWLCSDAASFVTGHAMVVDGGMRTL